MERKERERKVKENKGIEEKQIEIIYLFIWEKWKKREKKMKKIKFLYSKIIERKFDSFI